MDVETKKQNYLINITEKIPIVHVEDNIETVKNLLSKRAHKFDSIDYIYVTDKKRFLKGVI